MSGQVSPTVAHKEHEESEILVKVAKKCWSACHDFEQLELLIKARSSESSNLKYADLKILRRLQESGDYNYFLKLIPSIETLAKEIDVNKNKLAVFNGGMAMAKILTISRRFVATILANAFFCTFDDDIAKSKGFPTLNFSGLYIETSVDSSCAKLEKLKCILEYFRQVTTLMESASFNRGEVSFRMDVIEKSRLDWLNSTLPLSKFYVNSQDSLSNSPPIMAQVVSASKDIGGGVLEDECFQEQIKFVTHPEMIAARLLFKTMEDNEAITIHKAFPYSKCSGYGKTFKFEGPDNCSKTDRVDHFMIAIDSEGDPMRQFKKKFIDRELLKAYAGFSMDPRGAKIATGDWSAEILRGDQRVTELKVNIQWLAASMAKKEIHFYCYGNPVLYDACVKLKKEQQATTTIGELYSTLLCRYDDDSRS